ncbi:MAG: VOC family protein, partial [Candidatus Aquilonibacter sp.]|jgi:catechol 2,3-dioxygenase-like lactoylglutathione lyase family enzyme
VFSVVMLVCNDLARSREFYRNVMGLKQLSDRSPHWIEFELSAGVTFGLHQGSDLLAVRPGSLQLGFTLENVDRFVADCGTLSVPILQYPYNEGPNRIAVISDPDGYPIQIGSKR